ncbi:MAG: CHAD domain-containing protein [Limisphaerales bacterium]
MGFHFKKRESVTRSARRVCRERLDHALERLGQGAGADGVHETRRAIKKLRAVLRLVRAGIGKTAYDEAANALRASAHRLNAMRDAQVRLSALEDVAKRANGAIAPQLLRKLKDALLKNRQMEEQKFGKSADAAKRFLFEARGQLASLKVAPNQWKAVGAGLKKIYRRGRKAWAIAKCQPSPQHFHEWRRRVKDLSNQLRLLRRARPRKVKARMQELDRLADILGDDHDLFMLGQFAGKNI